MKQDTVRCYGCGNDVPHPRHQCRAKMKIRTPQWSAELCCIKVGGHDGDHAGSVRFSDAEAMRR